MNKKIGIFGGTFNPVHMAHLHMAQCALEQAQLDKVIFVPNGAPPHKQHSSVLSAEHRYNMLMLATEDNPGFEVSDYEIAKDGYCYTVDTMRYFKGQYPGEVFVFIIGADSLDYVDKWHEGHNLIRENHFVVVEREFRPGYSLADNLRKIADMGGSAEVVQMPPINISSTYIRDVAASGCNVEYLTTPKVGRYIRDNKLYC